MSGSVNNNFNFFGSGYAGLGYYALLVNQWINGISLSQIINESIIHFHLHKKNIQIGWINNKQNLVLFEKNNPLHINTLANNIIDDIEHRLRFLFEKYFDHYHRNLINLLGEEDAGPSWALFLEYGTQDTTNIALQNLGLSRHTANEVRKKCFECLKIIDGKLHAVDKAGLMLRFPENTLEYDEVMRFFMRRIIGQQNGVWCFFRQHLGKRNGVRITKRCPVPFFNTDVYCCD